MATYPPPTETLPTFNSTVFTSPLTDGLTVAEADGRYLKFPSSQGGETINGNLVVSGASTLSSVITNTITGTAVGTAVSLYNEATRTGGISIGTGNTTGSVPITIGNQTGSFGSVDIGSTTISIGKNNCATNNIGTSTGGTLNLKTGSTGGAINMGTSMTSGTIVLGGTTGGTSTLTVNRPIAPAYLPSAIGATNIGYQASSTNNTYTSAIAGVFEVMNTGSITAGVWMVEGCFVFSGATGGGRRMGLNTTSAVMTDTRTQGVATGTFAQLVVSSIFSFSTATTVYLNIDITAGLGGAGTNISTLRWTRLA